MVRTCCIKRCTSESYGGCGISFHRFPKNKELLQKWINSMPFPKKITKTTVICSRHFKREDFTGFSLTSSRQLLIPTAVPSIFPVNKPMVGNVYNVSEEVFDSNQSDESDESDEFDESDEDEDNLHSSPIPPDSSPQSETSNNAKSIRVEASEETEEVNTLELEAVSANVTCKLKRMNSEQRCHAELLINKVLYHGLKNDLTPDTDLAEMEHPPD